MPRLLTSFNCKAREGELVLKEIFFKSLYLKLMKRLPILTLLTFGVLTSQAQIKEPPKPAIDFQKDYSISNGLVFDVPILKEPLDHVRQFF